MKAYFFRMLVVSFFRSNFQVFHPDFSFTCICSILHFICKLSFSKNISSFKSICLWSWTKCLLFLFTLFSKFYLTFFQPNRISCKILRVELLTGPPFQKWPMWLSKKAHFWNSTQRIFANFLQSTTTLMSAVPNTPNLPNW